MRVDAGHVAGEAPGDGHPPRPDRGGRVGLRTLCPHERGLDSDCLGADGIEIRNKGRQEPVCLSQVMTKGSS